MSSISVDFNSSSVFDRRLDSFETETSEPVHEISNNVVCAASKASDQPAHMHSLIRAFASHLSIFGLLSH